MTIVKKIIKEYGHGAGKISFFTEECKVEGIGAGISLEINSIKVDGAETPLLTKSYIREVCWQRTNAVFPFSAEVIKVFGLKVGDIVEVDYKVIKGEPHPEQKPASFVAVVSEGEGRIQKQLDDADAERIRRELEELKADNQQPIV